MPFTAHGDALRPTGSGEYWGELYLKTTLPFLSEATTRKEAAYLARAFAEARGPVVDLGCGHGRHAALLAEAGLRIAGLDRDAASLALRPAGLAGIRGDFRELPFGDGALAGAYAWYSTLFIHSDAQNAATLREVSRVLRRGARLLIHTVPFERLERAPQARFETTLPDGTHLVEQSRFDASTGVDVGHRELSLPDGRVLCGRYSIRYYPLTELLKLLWAAGLMLRWVHGDLDGRPLTPQSTDLILAAERTDA